MKHLVKIAGLCFASMLVMAMAITATASAAAHWLVCLKEHSGTTTTKWGSGQCSGVGTGWEWSPLQAGTQQTIEIKGSLKLRDTKTLVGEVEVECYGKSLGFIFPTGKNSKVEKVEVLSCRSLKGCEAGTASAAAVNLPWETEFNETEKKILLHLLPGNKEGKEPGWEVKCKVAGLAQSDTCTTEKEKGELLLLENRSTSGELLVLATFEKTRNAKCTKGGEGAGQVEGSVGILLESGAGLSVSS